MVVHCILATDMGMHDDYVQRIERQGDYWHNNDIDLNDEFEKDQERLTICGALIKCADIGNCVCIDYIFTHTHWLFFFPFLLSYIFIYSHTLEFFFYFVLGTTFHSS